MDDKTRLRKQLRAARREEIGAQNERIRALLFKRPPADVLSLVPDGGTVGLYAATQFEAPAAAYARWFAEAHHTVALPRFADRTAPMEFAKWTDPFGESDLVEGPYGMQQPTEKAERVVPDVLIVPLVGFTPDGDRLGQGGGHYDRWLADHPKAATIGLAWDGQCVDALPVEPHDRRMDAVVTPTRLYGPFA